MSIGPSYSELNCNGRLLLVMRCPVLLPGGGTIDLMSSHGFTYLGSKSIGGVKGAPEVPWYVVDKHIATNELVVAQGHDHPALMSDSLVATDVHWIAGSPPAADMVLAAKTRYRQTEQACRLRPSQQDRCEVEFVDPQRAVTPGQSVVFYSGEVCLGGGIITSTGRR